MIVYDDSSIVACSLVVCQQWYHQALAAAKLLLSAGAKVNVVAEASVNARESRGRRYRDEAPPKSLEDVLDEAVKRENTAMILLLLEEAKLEVANPERILATAASQEMKTMLYRLGLGGWTPLLIGTSLFSLYVSLSALCFSLSLSLCSLSLSRSLSLFCLSFFLRRGARGQ